MSVTPTRRSLIGIPVPWERSVSDAIGLAGPGTVWMKKLLTIRRPRPRPLRGVVRTDMMIISSEEVPTLADAHALARQENMLLARPQELWAVGAVETWLASDMELKTLVVIAPRTCRVTDDSYDYGWPEENMGERPLPKRVVFGVRWLRYHGSTRGNRRIVHPYWFDGEFPEHYWLLFVDKGSFEPVR